MLFSEDVDSEKRPGLFFPFIMGSAPCILTVLSVFILGFLTQHSVDPTTTEWVALSGILGGIFNALYTAKTGREDKGSQIRAVIFYIPGCIIGAIGAKLILADRVVYISPLFTLIVVVLGSVYLVLMRIMDTQFERRL